ncbi:virulence protein [Escherichia coli]|uniref:Virulence protein n=1 Tax=Escherichia coli TaxID=562 RepID=A0A376U0V7_ECOLX|nr:virulence protein [Escherichia coli]
MLSLFYNKTVIARLTFSVILTQMDTLLLLADYREPLKIPDLMLFGAQPGLLWDFPKTDYF